MNTKKTINDSRLVTLLKVLNSKEMRSLSNFVVSPFFNKKKEVIQLFEYLKRQHPEFKKLYRSNIYCHLFPEKKHADNLPLNDKQYAELRYVMSDLVKLVKQYLLYGKQTENEVRQNCHLADIFLSRGLAKYVPELLKDAKKKHANRPEGTAIHLHDKYILSEIEVNYVLTLDPTKEIGMQAAINNFHQHALAGQLRLYAAALSREQTMPNAYNYLMESELVDYISANENTQTPIVNAYYRIFMLFRGEDVQTHYPALRNILTEKSSYFPPSELRHLYSLLLNFCNLQINRGYLEYNVEKFKIYEHTFSESIWYYDRYISREHFVLAVRAGLAIKNFEGAKSIIEQYGGDLNPRYQASIIDLMYVFLFFAEKKYVEAHETLIKMGNPPEGFFFGIYYRQLSVQIYYELSVQDKKYNQLLKSNIDNFLSYLGRAVISNRNKTLYTNFVSILKSIYKKRFQQVNPPSENAVQKIKDKINNPETLLVAREWLLEKVEELEAYWRKKR